MSSNAQHHLCPSAKAAAQRHATTSWCWGLQVEFPIAIIDRNIDKQPPEARVAAEAFIRYCFTPEAQREFADCGFRYEF